MNNGFTLEERMLRQIKAPTLGTDDKWLEVMGPWVSDLARMLMDQQRGLVEEDRLAGRSLIELKLQKKEALAELLELTDRLQRNDQDAERRSERLKNLLERINEEMDQIQFKMELAPGEIRRLNAEILEESIPLGYDKLMKDHQRIGELETKIQAMRQELLAMNEEKFALEEQATALGQYLHALLGKELSDALDARFLHQGSEAAR